MRFLTAPYIFPINKSALKNGILVIDDSGKIMDLLSGSESISQDTYIETFDGLLCPGFINTHCHLELSHLKGVISPKKSLPFFIEEIIQKRNSNRDQLEEAMTKANEEMIAGGIVAVGDISNSTDSIEIKRNSRIHYHTFIEIFDITPARADEVFTEGKKLRDEFLKAGLNASIAPHAPYTVSENLLKKIFIENDKIKTIHNQETESENEMFFKGTGLLIDKMKKISGAFNTWNGRGKSSLQSILSQLPDEINLQLVHNTFTSEKDLDLIPGDVFRNLFWCLCVNANLYIESRTPDIRIFQGRNARITIGTDSYASNTSLSVLSELKTISDLFPVSLENLLKWATLNGAEFLKMDKQLGSFEKGKSPGVLSISDIDETNTGLRKYSRITRVV